MENNLTRFVESVTIDNKLIKGATSEELKEALIKFPPNSYKLNESALKGIDFEKESNCYWLPVSRYSKTTPNLNGRIYGKNLWTRVIEEQRDIWQYGPVLINHPIDDGSPRDICAIILDAKMDDDPNEGFVYGLIKPIESENGKLLESVINAYGKIGCSSSGFGQIIPGTQIVNPDNFLIERICDWVLNPSQSVWAQRNLKSENHEVVNISKGFNESTENNNSTSISESEETTSDKITEESDNNINTTNNFKENNKVVKDSKIAKLEEKKFRRDMESFLEEASAIKDPQERLQEFREIESYLEDGACPDLREKIEQKIAEEEEYIKAAIKEKSELKEKFDVDNIKGLEEKITKIVEDKTLLEQDARDWKKVSESLQNKLNEAKKELDDRPTQTFVEYLNTKIDTLKASMDTMSKKAYSLVKKFSEANKALKNDINSLNEKIKGLEDEKEKMMGELRTAHENAASSNVIAERAVSDKKTSDNNLRALAENYNTLRAHYEKAILDIKNLNDNIKANGEASLNEKISLETELNELKERNNSLLKIIADQRTLIEEKTAKEMKLTEKVEAQKKQLSSMASELKTSQFELYGEKTKEVRKAKVEGSPIVNYYESLYENYGNAIVPFKEMILKSRTLKDAQGIFFTAVLPKLRESQEIEEMRLPENAPLKTKMEKMKGFDPNRSTDVADRLPKGWM